MRRLVTIVAWCDIGFIVVAAALNVVSGTAANLVAEVFFLVFPVVALVILRARRTVAVAGCFAVAALLNAVEKSGDALTTIGLRDGWPTAAVRVTAWCANWAWFPSLFLLVTVTLLRFPEGRLLSPRWRWVERASVASMAVWAVGLSAAAATVPPEVLITATEPVPPPGFARVVFRIGEPMFEVMVLCTLASVASLVLRFRRGDTVEQQQTKWVLSAAALAALVELTLTIRTFVVGAGHTPFWLVDAAEGVGFGLIAVATGVAITRHRLYEIDKVVSRTVAYGVVVALLAGVYVAVLTGLAALVPAHYGQVGVAAATLAVSALAVPLTRRVRRVVDHRFDRRRFDADRTVAGFAAHLRARPGENDVVADLLDVVARTVSPRAAGVWVLPHR